MDDVGEPLAPATLIPPQFLRVGYLVLVFACGEMPVAFVRTHPFKHPLRVYPPGTNEKHSSAPPPGAPAPQPPPGFWRLTVFAFALNFRLVIDAPLALPPLPIATGAVGGSILEVRIWWLCSFVFLAHSLFAVCVAGFVLLPTGLLLLLSVCFCCRWYAY